MAKCPSFPSSGDGESDECKNVWLQGVIFQNSPAWNLHPLMCENVLVEDVQVRNPSYAQNGDGLDLESCKNALIVNSTFDVGMTESV